ncbi:MAG: hypothetical protein JRF33_18995 [Deltaproteobacteria bacterium]|nr:hypothetical protein [Deltaproteobacteria bacterium]
MPPKKPYPVKPLKPLKPVKPLKPLKPVKPVKPLKPLKPMPTKPLTGLDRETQKILALKEEIGQRFWELGQCLIRVHDQRLYSPGFDSFERYLGRRGVNISKPTAYRMMDVARNFSRFIARKHGQTKLLAAIDLTRATPEDDRPVDVLAYQIEVRESGKVSQKTFTKASSREIKLAANRIKRKYNPKPKPLKPTWQLQAQRAVRAIAPKAKLQIKMGAGRDPEVKLTLSGVPQSKLREALIRLTQVVSGA